MMGPGLFAPDSPRLWTIPPGVDFLAALAGTLVDASGLKSDPAALADALIYVPNRRSARALALALHRAAGTPTILPPDIRALGDLETEEPPSGAEEALAGLGPALSPARRLGALARLVMAFYAAREEALPVLSAIAAARELARLLDQAALSGAVDWGNLRDLVTRSDLAAHWQASAEFLAIVTEHWPAWLAEEGASEPYERRLKVAEAIAVSLQVKPPAGPVIIAGSTGATPASRVLMKAALRLPGGLVVLPGLDRDADPAAWADIAGEADHPQFALAGTLAELGVSAPDVPAWPGADEGGRLQSRRKLIHESLAPANRTADWLARLGTLAGSLSPPDFAARALEGLSLIEAEDEAHEALLAALLLRETLEQDGLTAALVTSDAGLARQVSAALKRWGVDVPPSGGIPLGRSEAGALLLLAADWACDTGDPARLAALLRHDLVQADADAVAALDRHYLRGPRLWDGLAGFANRFDDLTSAKNASRHDAVPADASASVRALLFDLTRRTQAFVDGFASDQPGLTGSEAAERLIGLIAALTGSRETGWAGPDGEAAARCLEAAAVTSAALPPMTGADFAEMLTALAATSLVPEPGSGHPRLSIWGPLEARLQQADRIVLAGLNENVWPDRPAADGFLPRRFRGPLGLAEPEARLGLAAHDFAQLACAPDVVMLWSARREDAPAVTSRWILRLKTLVQGALGAGAEAALGPEPARDPRPWALALRADTMVFDARKAEPRPKPPVEARPKRLSVTRVDRLQRDPYAIYAESILKLNRLRPMDEAMDARLRGTALHAGIEAFDKLAGHDQTQDRLTALLLDGLVAAGHPAHLVAAERGSLKSAAAQLFEWWSARRGRVTASWPEADGKLEIMAEGSPFRLTGTADRVEQFYDGTLSVLDFKTGGMPTKKEIEAGFEQQLPLLALMARDGQLGQAPGLPVGVLGYVAVKMKFEDRTISSSAAETQTLVDRADEILTKLISAYRQPETPYLSVPRVQLKSKYAGDFDRLARRDEWAGEDGDD